MRGGVLLAVGVVAMIAALCFAVAVAVYAARQSEEPAHAPRTPAAPAVPVEELERKENVPRPEREKAVKEPRLPEPSPEIPNAPPPVAAPPEEPETRPEPVVDTKTLVTVRTCEGGRFRINAAEKEMYDLHNQTRERMELGTLCVSPDLTRVARAHSRDMLDKNYFSHYAPDGTSVTDEMEALGYPVSTSYITGENIALGSVMSTSPSQIFAGLMDSPGHRDNILEAQFREVGVGAVTGIHEAYSDDPATAYTVDFGARVPQPGGPG